MSPVKKTLSQTGLVIDVPDSFDLIGTQSLIDLAAEMPWTAAVKKSLSVGLNACNAFCFSPSE